MNFWAATKLITNSFAFYGNLIKKLTSFCSLFSSVLLIQAIAAIPTTTSTASVIKNERNKKAVNVSQSPITYVQHLYEPGHEAKINRPKRNKGKTDKHKNAMSNHELLNSLGLGKLPSPSNHHRKRLASTQSRHVGRPDDSRVFIVKLPPNPYYYSHSSSFNPAVNDPNSIDDKSKKVNLVATCCTFWFRDASLRGS